MRTKRMIRLSGAAILCFLLVSCVVCHSKMELLASSLLNPSSEERTTEVPATCAMRVNADTLRIKPISKKAKRRMPKSFLIPRTGYAELRTTKDLSRVKAGNVLKIGYHVEDSDVSKGNLSIYQVRIRSVDG